MQEDSRIFELLECMSQNLNAVVQNQAHIYAELEKIKQEIKEQSAE